jgi:polysaccharide transporter, PST family
MILNLSSLLMVPFLARALGPSSWGILILAQTVNVILVPIAEYGFNYSSSREIVKDSDNEKKLSEIISVTLFGQLFLIILLGILFLLVAVSIDQLRDNLLIFSVGIIYGFSNALLPWYYYMGTKNIKNLAYTSIIARMLPVFFIITLVNEPGDSWMFFLFLLIPNIINLLYHYIKIGTKHRIYVPVIRSLIVNIKENYSVFLSRYLRQIKQPAMTFILGMHLSPAQFSFFGGSAKIHKVIDGASEPFNKVLFPKFVRNVQENLKNAERSIGKIILFQVIGSTILVLVIIFFSEPIIRIILGNEYMEASAILSIMLLALPIQIANRLYSHLWLFANELEKEFLRAMVPILIGTLILSYFTSQYFGAIGICVLIILSELVVSFSMVLISRKRIKGKQ